MFCPECRAEYRAGFTRCSDCDVDLVQELSESATRMRKAKRQWTTTPSTIKSMYRDGRKTTHWWAVYKHQTGTWPGSSIAIHVINWIVILFGGGFLIWWTAEHHLSRWQFLGIFLLIGLPYGVVANWAKRRAKLNHLRNRKRLAKQHVRIEMSRNQRSVSYWAKSGLTFVAHQLMVTEGVSWLVTLGGFTLRSTVRQVHGPWGDSAIMRGMHLILTNTPLFPIQVVAGAYIGWRFYRRWGHRSMLWVWILPGLLLTYAVFAIPSFSPWAFPSSADTGPLSHYFGWGCQADNRCYDQMTFTMPFYISVAYSLGALWASRRLRSSPLVKDKQP